MKTELLKFGGGIYELKILNSNQSYCIELREESYWDDLQQEGYNVTMMEDDEPVDFIGIFDTHFEAIEHIKNLYSGVQ